MECLRVTYAFAWNGIYNQKLKWLWTMVAVIIFSVKLNVSKLHFIAAVIRAHIMSCGFVSCTSSTEAVIRTVRMSCGFVLCTSSTQAVSRHPRWVARLHQRASWSIKIVVHFTSGLFAPFTNGLFPAFAYGLFDHRSRRMHHCPLADQPLQVWANVTLTWGVFNWRWKSYAENWTKLHIVTCKYGRNTRRHFRRVFKVSLVV